MARERMFDSSSDLGAEWLGLMAALFDPPSTMLLDEIGVGPGWRCLELGGGEGSIARWMARRSGPAGRVVAVDLDTDHLSTPPGVEVHRHDITEGLPVVGTFDVIHARNVLMGITDRERVFKTLVDAVAPGGWLVVGDARERPQQVLATPGDADAELVDRVIRVGIDRVVNSTGASWQWADEAEPAMAAAGLIDVHGLEYCRMLSGGNVACQLNDNYVRQMEPALLRLGITPEELARFHALMSDPQFRAWPFLQMVYSAGRKPNE